MQSFPKITNTLYKAFDELAAASDWVKTSLRSKCSGAQNMLAFSIDLRQVESDCSLLGIAPFLSAQQNKIPSTQGGLMIAGGGGGGGGTYSITGGGYSMIISSLLLWCLGSRVCKSILLRGIGLVAHKDVCATKAAIKNRATRMMGMRDK